LDHYLRDRGAWGDAAESASADLASLRRLVPEYMRLADTQRTSPSPANEAEMIQAGRDVLRTLTRLQASSFDRMLSAHATRAERFENELVPLDGSLAALEVGSWESGRPDGPLRMEWTRPEAGMGVNMDIAQPETSFSRSSPQDLVRADVSVADAAAGQRVLARLQADGLVPASARFDGTSGVFNADVPFRRSEGGRTVTGTNRVSIRIHVDANLAAQPVSAPLSRVDAASHGYELAGTTAAIGPIPFTATGVSPSCAAIRSRCWK
jgi:hypothetical protein